VIAYGGPRPVIGGSGSQGLLYFIGVGPLMQESWQEMVILFGG